MGLIGPAMLLIAIAILGYARVRPESTRTEFSDFIVIPSAAIALIAFGVALTIRALTG